MAANERTTGFFNDAQNTMSDFKKCDVCLRTINERSAGWVRIVTHRGPTPVTNDVCSPGCHRMWLDEEYPHRRPDFAAARVPLQDQVDAILEDAAS